MLMSVGEVPFGCYAWVLWYAKMAARGSRITKLTRVDFHILTEKLKFPTFKSSVGSQVGGSTYDVLGNIFHLGC